MTVKALFLDRDGIVNHDNEYVSKIDDFVFKDSIFDLCREFIKNGYDIIIITNQSGIAMGFYTETDFFTLNAWMLEQFSANGITIKKVYYCPHHPEGRIKKYSIDCVCRKPAPGMIFQARDELDVDLRESVLIGDKESDIAAGKKAGVGKNILLRSRYTAENLKSDADLVIDDLVNGFFLK